MKNNKVQEKLCRMHIQGLRDAADIIDQILPIVRTYIGKYFNCKFEKVLSSIAQISVRESLNKKCIVWHNLNDTVPCGECCVSYIDDSVRWIILCNIPLSPDKRIEEKIVTDLIERKEQLLQQAECIEADIKRLPAARKEFDKLMSELIKIYSSFSSCIHEYYDWKIL